MEDNPVFITPLQPISSRAAKLFQEALDIISGPRRDVYGSPAKGLATIAELWQSYLRAAHGIDVIVRPSDVAMMMSLLKIARFARAPHHHDTLVDIVGYAGCCEELMESAI